MPTPNVPVWGNEYSDFFSNGVDYTRGTSGYFGNDADPPANTGKGGVLVVNNAKAPAYWNLFWLQPWSCGYNTNPQQPPVYEGQEYYQGVDWWEYEAPNYLVQNYYINGAKATMLCVHYGPLSPATTRFAIVGQQPHTLTLTSNGMPLLYVYDKTGSIVSTLTATSVSGDGSQATFPFPSSLPQSGYSLAVGNQSPGSPGFSPAGTNLLSIASSTTVPGNPFGVSVGSQKEIEEICPCQGNRRPASP